MTENLQIRDKDLFHQVDYLDNKKNYTWNFQTITDWGGEGPYMIGINIRESKNGGLEDVSGDAK